MTAVRLFVVTALLTVGACATPRTTGPATVVPTMGPRFELCNDPSFQCGPNATPAIENAIQLDTNFTTPLRAPRVG
ncbi:MAG: hypothetical protein ABI175_20495 [Polyangiales bacterium]